MSVQPPFVPPFSDATDSMVIPEAVQAEFVQGIIQGIKSEMEMIANTSGEIEGHWKSLVTMTRSLHNESREVVEDVQRLRLTDAGLARTETELQHAGLSPAVVSQVMLHLSREAQRAEAEEHQQTTADEATKAGKEAEKAEKAERQKAAQKPSPYADVIETGGVDPRARPDAGEYAEGRSRKAPRTTADEIPVPMSLDEGIRMGSNVGELRQAASNRVNRWASEWGQRYKPEMTEGGTWLDPDAGADYERSMGRIGQVTGVMDALGKGGGLSGALGAMGGMAARVAGPVGLAYGATNLVGNTLTGQREANRDYQQIYGGSQMDSYGQRAQEALFSRVQMFGTMDSGMASQLFQGVSRQGLQGDDRQEALDFATENYTRFGTDISTSLKLIEIASKDGVDVLGEYQKSLDALSEVAKESGVAISEAHEAYVTALQKSQAITSGTAADTLATSISGVDISLKDTPLEGLDTMGMITDQYNRVVVGRELGMTPSQIEGAVQAGDQDVIGELVSRPGKELVNLLGIPRKVAGNSEVQAELAAIEAQVQGGVPTSDQAVEYTRILLDNNIYNHDAAVQVARQIGITNATDAQISQLIAHGMMDSNLLDFSEQIEKTHEARDNSESSLDVNGKSLRSGPLGGLFDGRAHVGAQQDLLKDWGFIDEDAWIAGTGYTYHDEARPIYDSLDNYLSGIASGDIRSRSGALDSIYSGIGAKEPEEIEAWSKRTFKTVDGEEFGWKDLPDHIDQIERGEVMTEDDKWLHDVLGYDVDPEAKSSKKMSLRELLETTTNMALESAGAAPLPSRGTASEQIVRVEPIGPLAEWMRFTSEGGLDGSAARNRGIPMEAFDDNGLGRLESGR